MKLTASLLPTWPTMLNTPRMEILKLGEVTYGQFSWKRKKTVMFKQDKHQLQHTCSAFPI